MNILSDKKVVTRKEHNCFGCARKIPKGTEMKVITSVDGGDISSDYWCKVCQMYWNEYAEDGDTISYGDLRMEDSERWGEVRKQIEQIDN